MQIREPVDQPPDGDTAFESGQRRPRAGVDAGRKRQMPVWRAAHIQVFGIWKLGRITVRRPNTDGYQSTFG